MEKLQLDYQQGSKPIPWAGAALLVISIGVSALAGWYYQNLTEKTAYWKSMGGQVSAHAHANNGTNTALEIKHANEVLSRIDLPWEKLFQAVESSSGREVALLAMEPDAEKSEMKITGEAKNLDAVMKYTRLLAEQKVFSNVYLQSHQVQTHNAEQPVRFSLVASWEGAP
jgi:hypothetical protein